MMEGGWPPDLSDLSIPAIGLGAFLTMFLGAAAGTGLRRWRNRRSGREPQESQASVAHEGYLISSVLGLLGLILAFSFAMVLDRYETRRDLAIKHANAIGTAYLRIQLLDEPHRSRLSTLLLQYTVNRGKLATAGTDRTAIQAANDRLLTEIWAAVVAARESAQAHGLTTALLTTFNEVIDLDTERKVTWELRLPDEVLLLLTLYLAITAGLVGYQIDGPRGRRAALVLFVLIALSIAIIADINRPMTGEEREVHKPLQMLLKSLSDQPPRVFDRFARGAEIRP